MAAVSASVSDPIAALAAVNWSFPTSRSDYATHRLHPWPGRFIPQIPAAAIALLSRTGDWVVDPFCGCGTTSLEARLAGRNFYASDANPLATLITRAKLSLPDLQQRADLEDWSKGLRSQDVTQGLLERVPPIPNREYWFSNVVATQLAYLLSSIDELGHSRDFLRVVFSAVVTSVSNQESETRYRRVERDVVGDEVIERFQAHLRKALRAAESMDGAREVEGIVETRDAREPTSSLPDPGDLAVFSPPYPNSFDYHLYHRFRMFWLGFDPVGAKHTEIGAHLRYEPDEAGWRSDMVQSLRHLASMLRPGAYAVCVVGDGIIRGRLIRTAELLSGVALMAGFAPLASFERSIPADRKSFKASDGRLREENVVLLQKN